MSCLTSGVTVCFGQQVLAQAAINNGWMLFTCETAQGISSRPPLMSFCLIQDHVPGVSRGNSLKLAEICLAFCRSPFRWLLFLLQSIAGWKGYETDHEIQLHMLSPHTNDCKILSWHTCKLRIYSMELVFEPLGSEERRLMWICTSLKLCAPAVPCQVLIKAVWDSRG